MLSALLMIEVIFNRVTSITTHSPTCHLAELLIHRYPPPREHRWEARDTGDRVICGGCARREHQRRDMLFRGGLDQVQSQIVGGHIRALGGARSDRAY